MDYNKSEEKRELEQEHNQFSPISSGFLFISKESKNVELSGIFTGTRTYAIMVLIFSVYAVIWWQDHDLEHVQVFADQESMRAFQQLMEIHFFLNYVFFYIFKLYEYVFLRNQILITEITRSFWSLMVLQITSRNSKVRKLESGKDDYC